VVALPTQFLDLKTRVHDVFLSRKKVLIEFCFSLHMNILKCPKCGSLLDVYIGALRPMEAVSADMLEKGIIYHCPNCHSHNFNASNLICPQCKQQTLRSSITEKAEKEQIVKLRSTVKKS